MGKTIGLKGLFRMASGASKGGGESYPGDHRSAGNTGGSKARISRVKGGGGKKSPATRRGYKSPPSRRPGVPGGRP
tara:strand:+ start:2545 stop:2772 length:228 start_codon:yes stop_codon:yes gene_type:complete